MDLKKKKKYFKYYMADRKNEFCSQYDHEKSWNKLQQRIRERKLRRIGFYTAVASAALIILIFGIDQMFINDIPLKKESVEVAIDTFPEIGSRKAILTLEGGEKVDLSVRKGTITSDSSVVVNNSDNQMLTYEKKKKSNTLSQKNTLTVPRGGEYQLILSDGTIVWMNAESMLRYPTSFSGSKREVFLEGEAFFEVARDTKHPFIVNTDRHSVEALGTSFNISAYPDSKVYTTLAEGKVKVKTSNSSVILVPNFQAIIEMETDEIVTRQVPANLFTSWTKGNYEFRNTSLEEIVAQLSRWYNVDIYFKNESLKNKRFAGIIFRNEELSFAIETIEKVSEVHFTRVGEVIYIEENHR